MKVLLREMAENIGRITAARALVHEQSNVMCILRLAADYHDDTEIHQQAYARGMRFIELSAQQMLGKKRTA